MGKALILFARFEQPVHVPGADSVPLGQDLDDVSARSLSIFGQFAKFTDESIDGRELRVRSGVPIRPGDDQCELSFWLCKMF